MFQEGFFFCLVKDLSWLDGLTEFRNTVGHALCKFQEMHAIISCGIHEEVRFWLEKQLDIVCFFFFFAIMPLTSDPGWRIFVRWWSPWTSTLSLSQVIFSFLVTETFPSPINDTLDFPHIVVFKITPSPVILLFRNVRTSRLPISWAWWLKAFWEEWLRPTTSIILSVFLFFFTQKASTLANPVFTII